MEGQGVRSTPSASTSSLPRSRTSLRIECDTAAARYHHVTLAQPGDAPSVRRERSVVPVPELSQTEERIVRLLAEGLSKGEIAEAVGLDERTVDWHLTRAGRKLAKASALLEQVRRQDP